jgi:hypothetical protein
MDVDQVPQQTSAIAPQASQSGQQQQQQTTQQSTQTTIQPTQQINVNQSNPNPIHDLEAERRKPLIANMEKIEKEFQEKKEQFFTEKIEELTTEYESIRNGKSSID